MKPHPIANLFPLMSGDDFTALVDDIKANGLREPIILLDDQVLDGRNRYRACKEAGVDPKFELFEGADPLSWVVSKNLHRRHLTESQRSAVGAKLSNTDVGKPNSANLQNNVTQSKAAEMMNVSTRSVATAKQIQKTGTPELNQAVDEGKVSLNKASKLAKEPEDVQREAVANETFEAPKSEYCAPPEEEEEEQVPTYTRMMRYADSSIAIIDRIKRGHPEWKEALLKVAAHVNKKLGKSNV